MSDAPVSNVFLAFHKSFLHAVGFARFSHVVASRLEEIFDGAEVEEEGVLADLRRDWRELKRHTSPDRYQRIIFELLLCRSIEGLNHYMSRMLARVFVERPETLKTSDMVPLRDVIESHDLPSFIAQTAEKKVHELAYKGLRQLIEHLNKNLRLAFDESSPLLGSVCEAIEVRNIIVHNAGRVNAVFIERTGRHDVRSGDVFPLTFEYVLKALEDIPQLAEELDGTLMRKFQLPQASPRSSSPDGR